MKKLLLATVVGLISLQVNARTEVPCSKKAAMKMQSNSQFDSLLAGSQVKPTPSAQVPGVRSKSAK